MYVHLFQGADEMTSSAMEETLANAGLDPLVSALSLKFAGEEKISNKISNSTISTTRLTGGLLMA